MSHADVAALQMTADAAFDDLPRIEVVADLSDLCGSKGLASREVIYCTTENRIYLRNGAKAAEYRVAHVLGHAVQVRHGVADVALRTIRARPRDEQKLRGWVTRQVECIAGFLLARSGVERPNLAKAFASEPFTGSHWGRNPIRIGPRVSIGLEERQTWVSRGYDAESLKDCAVGDFGAELLLDAHKG